MSKELHELHELGHGNADFLGLVCVCVCVCVGGGGGGGGGVTFRGKMFRFYASSL